jgi:two-component system phosphate regulon response regulator PhoB
LGGGADDYLTKPISPAQLPARVTAIIWRQTRGYDAKLTGGDVELDLERKRVKRDGTSIHLGPTKFRLLEHFMRSQGRVYLRDQLLDSVLGMMFMWACER